MMERQRNMNDCLWAHDGLLAWSMLLLIAIFQLNFIFSCSLNHEGVSLLKFRERVVNDPYGALSSWKEEENGEGNHCTWFGIECDDGGHVVSLNLKNLCLEGTLAPELHHLLHIKSIILRNNSFSGFIPGELGNLKELELLDLSYNNFWKPVPPEFDYNIHMLLLDNNGLSCHKSPVLEENMRLSGVQADENPWTSSLKIKPLSRHEGGAKDVVRVRILQERQQKGESEENSSQNSSSASVSRPPGTSSDLNPGNPLETMSSQFPPIPPKSLRPHKPNIAKPPPPQTSSPDVLSPPSSQRASPLPVVIGAVGGFIALVLVIGLSLYFWKGRRIRMATGLSGQLRRAFVAGNDRSDGFNSDKPSFVEGIPNLKRSELETACEDFSNVIGSSSIGTIYKGTLANGVEIAVISLGVISAKDWSKTLETQFRKKIETLSKVNHKNFVNLIGYCEEEQPFTRLMVFEYAPNGSLFEHLHVREAEHLDWGMRLRVAMGMAYCLEHMHQLTPPVTHPNLNSSAVNLSEDYAAKISDFCFWNELAAPRVQPIALGMNSLSTASVSPERNVYSFGLLLLEMMTGRIPHSLEKNSLDDWVNEYMRGEQTLQELVDPMLRHFNPEQLDKINGLLRKCLHSEQNRPTMRDVTARLTEITGINEDKAAPRFSSLWWSELDSRSANGT